MYFSAEGCTSRYWVLKAPGASYGWLSVSNNSTESSLTNLFIVMEILVYKQLIFKYSESNPKYSLLMGTLSTMARRRDVSSFRIAHYPRYGQTLMVPPHLSIFHRDFSKKA